MVDGIALPSGQVDPGERLPVIAQSACRIPEVLRRSFRIIAFDWDGTAVGSRSEDATSVRLRIERLLRGGVVIVVITGTNFENVDRQLSARILGPVKQRLFICANRGSEVFGFDAASRPVVLWRRVATPEENRALGEVADEVQRVVEQRTGLPIQVVYDRMNRRKIDLIPVSEWAAPSKSELPALLRAVEGRLIGHGLSGGVRDVFDLAVQIARARGLPDARITSDVKHVEVGLTDKGDSIAWVLRRVAEPARIAADETLIVGDEFGPVGGVAGSDAHMMIPAARGATFVSVGAEPNGTPAGVVHLGGGPACFRALLDQLSDAAWVLVGEAYARAQEHEVESLFAVSNGRVGTRAAVSEHGPLERPAVFVAGAFKEDPATIPELVVAPDWADFRVSVEGEELCIARCATLDDRRLLDMRRGVFEHLWRCRDAAGRITRIRSQRFASLADRHVLVEIVTVSPENYSGCLRVEGLLDGRIATGPVSIRLVAGPVVGELSGQRCGALLCARLSVPRDSPPPGLVAFAATTCSRFAGTIDATLEDLRYERAIGQSWKWEAEIGLTYRVDKLVTVFASLDEEKPGRRAAEHLRNVARQGADALLAAHVTAWSTRWQSADVEIHGDEETWRAVRFALYHLISAADPTNDRVSIGARGLTGASYNGHVFWDTEIFILPVFVHTDPPSARALLMYRCHNLPSAREKARALGYRGALYPWESTDTGRETTPPWAQIPGGEVIPVLTGGEEHHVAADVAYATWQYWRATGDDGFLLEAGAEIVLETARFWASRVQQGVDGCYHIDRVIGPDEYHESVDDDAYTNGMARWNLERGVEVSQLLRARWPDRWRALVERLAIVDGEIAEWSAIAQKLYTGFDPTSGLFEQFRGYFGLEFLDLQAYEPRTAPIDVILGRERLARSQIIKQPDVILLIYLLWDQFPRDVREANFHYYAPRCAHGSSLSPSIHALVAARLGDRYLADRYLRQAASVDLANNLGNAAGGVHLGAQGGLWQSIVFGFAGVQVLDDGLSLDPRVPASWRTLSFAFGWRNRRLRISVSAKPATIDVVLEQGEPLTVALGEAGRRATIEPSKRYHAESRPGGWPPLSEVAP